MVVDSKPLITVDDPHGEFSWFDLAVVSNEKKFRPYMHNYAGWILNRMDNRHD